MTMLIYIKTIRNVIRLLKIELSYFYKRCRYTGFYRNNQAEAYWRILLLAHSLEKGLSISEKRINFGVDKAKDLIKFMKIYKNKENFVYLEGLAVLNQYYKHRVDNRLDVSFLSNFLSTQDTNNLPDAGIRSISIKTSTLSRDEFYKLCLFRHSVRKSDSYPTVSDIVSAIEIARLSPSACNRQMIKVFLSFDENKNLDLANVLPGNNGSKKEKMLYLFIAADLNSFDYFEQDQWYLNGGIFVSYLQLSFASIGVTSCIYQWPKNKMLDDYVSKKLSIPSNFQIVSVLGIGRCTSNSITVLASARKNTIDFISIS